MTKPKEDTLPNDDTDFVLEVINKENISIEILIMYEKAYRDLKRLANEFGLDTKMIDEAREKVMKKYGQI